MESLLFEKHTYSYTKYHAMKHSLDARMSWVMLVTTSQTTYLPPRFWSPLLAKKSHYMNRSSEPQSDFLSGGGPRNSQIWMSYMHFVSATHYSSGSNQFSKTVFW